MDSNKLLKSNANIRGSNFRNKYLDLFKEESFNYFKDVEGFSLENRRQSFNLIFKIKGIIKETETSNIQNFTLEHVINDIEKIYIKKYNLGIKDSVYFLFTILKIS